MSQSADLHCPRLSCPPGTDLWPTSANHHHHQQQQQYTARLAQADLIQAPAAAHYFTNSDSQLTLTTFIWFISQLCSYRTTTSQDRSPAFWLGLYKKITNSPLHNVVQRTLSIQKIKTQNWIWTFTFNSLSCMQFTVNLEWKLRASLAHTDLSFCLSLCLSLSLCFSGHFPGEHGLAGVYWSKGWWKQWWQLNYRSYKSCKAPVKSSPPTNQHPVSFKDRMPFLSPNEQCQSTEGKNITFHGLAYPKLTWGSSNFVFDH